jgi:hypothetical protein
MRRRAAASPTNKRARIAAFDESFAFAARSPWDALVAGTGFCITEFGAAFLYFLEPGHVCFAFG